MCGIVGRCCKKMAKHKSEEFVGVRDVVLFLCRPQLSQHLLSILDLSFSQSAARPSQLAVTLHRLSLAGAVCTARLLQFVSNSSSSEITTCPWSMHCAITRALTYRYCISKCYCHIYIYIYPDWPCILGNRQGLKVIIHSL